MTKFCWCMNIPPPMMAHTTFHELNSDLHTIMLMMYKLSPTQESMPMAEAAKTVFNNLANINAK